MLVAILVLAIGVLGAAGLQLASLRASKEAVMQSVAANLANEMAEKIRLSGKLGAATSPYLNLDFGATVAPPEAVDCYAVSCDQAKLVNFDLADWSARVRAELLGGRAVVCRDASPYKDRVPQWICSNSGPAVIKIGWRERRPDGSLVDPAGTQGPQLVLVL